MFKKYYQQCQANKDDYESFIKVFSQNYADLNALHPFREGNGRAQREYARLVCLDCGYDFNLSRTTHKEMLDASITSFNTGETAKFEKIFMKTVTGIDENNAHKSEEINILTSDDLYINTSYEYDYYEYSDSKEGLPYEEYYREKISNMNSTQVANNHHKGKKAEM